MLNTSVRMEAITRFVTAAQAMIDFPITVFIAPPPESEGGGTEEGEGEE